MKSAHDLAHVKSVTAWALMRGGMHAGHMVANWSDNPNGSVCTATVTAWYGHLAAKCPRTRGTGRAGGGGYDKLSAAVWCALKQMGHEPVKVDHGNGQTRQEFEALGYDVVVVLG